MVLLLCRDENFASNVTAQIQWLTFFKTRLSLRFQFGFVAGFKNTWNTKQPASMVFYAGRGMGISFQIGAGADADFGKMAGDFVRCLVSSKNGAEAGARAGKKSGPMEAPGWKFKNQIWSESFIQCGFSVNNFAK